MLLMSILNALLLARTAFLLATVLTMAHYIDAVLAPHLSALVKARVLDWDRSELVGLKAQWMWIRRIVQFQTCFAAECISIYILIVFRHAARSQPVLIFLYGLGVCSVILSVTFFVMIMLTGRYFQRSRVEAASP